jgi:hypothetical protein
MYWRACVPKQRIYSNYDKNVPFIVVVENCQMCGVVCVSVWCITSSPKQHKSEYGGGTGTDMRERVIMRLAVEFDHKWNEHIICWKGDMVWSVLTLMMCWKRSKSGNVLLRSLFFLYVISGYYMCHQV